MGNYMSAKEAAEYLGVNRRRILQLIENKLLKAEKIGNYWAIDKKSIENRKIESPMAGRPKLEK